MTRTGRTAQVIVASTRAAKGEYEDSSGALAARWLHEHGFDCPDPVIIADEDIPARLAALFDRPEDLPDVLITSGGTGVGYDDVTVETVRPHLDKELPGLVSEFFRRGAEQIPTAVLSGAVAGVVGRTFVMSLPGSRGGVADGLAVLEPVIDHLVGLLRDDAAGAHAPVGNADPAYVAEQTGQLIGVHISADPLEDLASAARRQVATAAMGAVVTFEGVVRDHDEGRGVTRLTYSSHPDAEQMMAEVVGGVVRRHPEVRAWAAHRVGELDVGDLAFVVVVAAAHRAPAFAAASDIADEVKARVPVWKEQEMSDGSTTWVGL